MNEIPVGRPRSHSLPLSSSEQETTRGRSKSLSSNSSDGTLIGRRASTASTDSASSSISARATTSATPKGVDVDTKIQELVNREIPFSREIGHLLGRPIIQHRRSKEFSEMLDEGKWGDKLLSDDQKNQLKLIKENFDKEKGKNCVTDLEYFYELQTHIITTLTNNYKDDDFGKKFGDTKVDEKQIKSIFQDKLEFLILVQKGRNAADQKTQTVAEKIFAPLFSLANAVFNITGKKRAKAAEDVPPSLKSNHYVKAAKEFANGKGKVFDDTETYYEALEQHLRKLPPPTTETVSEAPVSDAGLNAEQRPNPLDIAILWLVEKPKIEAKISESINKQPVLKQIIPDRLISDVAISSLDSESGFAMSDVDAMSETEPMLLHADSSSAMSGVDDAISTTSKTDPMLLYADNHHGIQFLNNKLREVAIGQLKIKTEVTVNEVLNLQDSFKTALNDSNSYGISLEGAQINYISHNAVVQLLMTSLGINEDIATKILNDGASNEKLKDIKLVNLGSSRLSWVESFKQSRIARARISEAKVKFPPKSHEIEILEKFAKGPGKAYENEQEFYAAFIQYAGCHDENVMDKAKGLYSHLSLKKVWNDISQDSSSAAASRRSSIAAPGITQKEPTLPPPLTEQSGVNDAQQGTSQTLPPWPSPEPAASAAAAAPAAASFPPGSPEALANEWGIELPSKIQVPDEKGLKKYFKDWVTKNHRFKDDPKEINEIKDKNTNRMGVLKQFLPDKKELYVALKGVEDRMDNLRKTTPEEGVVREIFLLAYREAYEKSKDNLNFNPDDLKKEIAQRIGHLFSYIGCTEAYKSHLHEMTKQPKRTTQNTPASSASAPPLSSTTVAPLPPPIAEAAQQASDPSHPRGGGGVVYSEDTDDVNGLL